MVNLSFARNMTLGMIPIIKSGVTTTWREGVSGFLNKLWFLQ